MAGGLGFEPRQAESESAVLPLDDPPRPPGRGARGATEAGRIAGAVRVGKIAPLDGAAGGILPQVPDNNGIVPGVTGGSGLSAGGDGGHKGAPTSQESAAP